MVAPAAARTHPLGASAARLPARPPAAAAAQPSALAAAGPLPGAPEGSPGGPWRLGAVAGLCVSYVATGAARRRRAASALQFAALGAGPLARPSRRQPRATAVARAASSSSGGKGGSSGSRKGSSEGAEAKAAKAKAAAKAEGDAAKAGADEGEVAAAEDGEDAEKKCPEMAEAAEGELEAEMHRKASSGDFAGAATARDTLSNGTIDDEAQVLCASTEFYEAFRKRDLSRMEALWLEAAYVKCIHPFEKWSVGYRDVKESWRKLFKDKSLKGSRIAVDDVNVNVRGLTAVVSCAEKVTSKGNRESYSVTNIFRKIGKKWMLIHRHVSPSEPVADYRGGGQVTLHLPQSIINQVSQMDDDSDEDSDDSDMDDSDLEMDDEDEESMFRFVVDGEDSKGRKKDEGAQETVRALRRLSEETLISGQARIRLISEMLSSPGKSNPERAYQLLLQEVDEKEKKAAWDDFAALMVVEAKRLETEAKRSEKGTGRR